MIPVRNTRCNGKQWSVQGMALSVVPTNIFDMLTGSQRASTLSASYYSV
ncbi:hypothetical protein OK016_19640 [Vibrio chagasii]|nr:hypothetical protein [Vibrio chagasii]